MDYYDDALGDNFVDDFGREFVDYFVVTKHSNIISELHLEFFCNLVS